MDSQNARRTAQVASLAVLALAVAGASVLPDVWRYRLDTLSGFYSQYRALEPPGLAIAAAFALITWFLATKVVRDDVAGEPWTLRNPRRAAVVAIGFAAIAVALGRHFVMHEFPVVDDEYSAWFQALIFAHGRTTAEVPAEWCRWIRALTPNTVAVNSCHWRSTLLPIHSLIRASFIAIRAEWLAGPVIAALSVLLVWDIARRLWPTAPHRAWLAAVMLALSSQFLFMAMTMFSMQTDLLFALAWLWLYVRDTLWSVALLPWLGFVALGIHSPYPHLFFIPPFLLRYLRNRRWILLAYCGAVYAFALRYWFGYFASAAGLGATDTAPVAVTATLARNVGLEYIHVPSMLVLVTDVMHLSQLLTWTVPVLLLCVIIAALSWRALDPISRDLFMSVCLVIAIRGWTGTVQGAGWGYRFVHGQLGQLALLAVVGLDVLANGIGPRRAQRLMIAACAVALLVQLPMRSWQVDRTIAPFYETSRYLETIPAKIVVAPTKYVAWGRSLVRNDPFFRDGPLLMDAYDLDSAGIDTLRARYPNQVRVVTTTEIQQFGLRPQINFAGDLFRVQPGVRR